MYEKKELAHLLYRNRKDLNDVHELLKRLFKGIVNEYRKPKLSYWAVKRIYCSIPD